MTDISPWVVPLAATLAANLRREYPCKIAHELHGDHDVAPPRALTPIFCGCFDWHSAVHSHWALVRLRTRADPALRLRIDGWLDASIGDGGATAELEYLRPRPGFELPYGLAWLLTLTGEITLSIRTLATAPGGVASTVDPSGRDPAERWARSLAPLEALARDRLVGWIRRLPAPIRSGEHTQSAFAMSLVLDWARLRGDGEAIEVVTRAAEAFHGGDRAAPLAYEPSAYDFLSPALGVAALMARVLPADRFVAWLDGFAPGLGRGSALAPVTPADRGDGKLVHWDGLNLSRAWMLAEVAAVLPDGDPRRSALRGLAAEHGRTGLDALAAATYAGSHWLPSFAIYWLTGHLAERDVTEISRT